MVKKRLKRDLTQSQHEQQTKRGRTSAQEVKGPFLLETCSRVRISCCVSCIVCDINLFSSSQIDLLSNNHEEADSRWFKNAITKG